MTEYDLVVVGTGSPGTSVASACTQAGWHVAKLIDWTQCREGTASTVRRASIGRRSCGSSGLHAAHSARARIGLSQLRNRDDVGGVERTQKRAPVNDFLQSRGDPAVYAVGDCADGGGLPLMPTAAQGRLFRSCEQRYTIPSLGMTGLTQQRACERGLRFVVDEGDSTSWYSSRRIRARQSRCQILVDERSKRIPGAHILGPHTEELINVFSPAIRE